MKAESRKLFLEASLDKKLKQVQTDFLHEKPIKNLHQIGSKHVGKINFEKDENFFSKDDVPTKAREKVAEVRQSIFPDILEIKQKKWNSSTIKNRKNEISHEKNLFHIRIGLSETNTIPIKESLNYNTYSVKNSKTPWNTSSSPDRHFLKNKELEKINEKAKEWNAVTSKDLLRNSKYESPIFKSELITKTMKDQKEKKKKLLDSLVKKHKYLMPDSTKEAINAAVFKELMEMDQAQKQTEYMEKHLKTTIPLSTSILNDNNNKTVDQLIREISIAHDQAAKPYLPPHIAHEMHRPDLSLTAHINQRLNYKHWNYASYCDQHL